MTDEAKEDQLLDLAHDIGVKRTAAILREWAKWDEFLDEIAGDVIDANLATDNDEVEKLQAELDEAYQEQSALIANLSRLHDAICEGRRQDAIDILSDISGERMRSVSEQHNLFPSRVPA